MSFLLSGSNEIRSTIVDGSWIVPAEFEYGMSLPVTGSRSVATLVRNGVQIDETLLERVDQAHQRLGRVVVEVVQRALLLLVEDDLDRGLRGDLGQPALRAQERLADQQDRQRSVGQTML